MYIYIYIDGWCVPTYARISIYNFIYFVQNTRDENDETRNFFKVKKYLMLREIFQIFFCFFSGQLLTDHNELLSLEKRQPPGQHE